MEFFKGQSECKNCKKCEHGVRRENCKKCGGSSICKHGRIRSQCKECDGSQICEHERRRSQCKECGGASICEHDRYRSHCKECGGSQICEHDRYRSQCKECGGSKICEHNRERSTCKECGGSKICKHGRIRYDCPDCQGPVISKRICKICIKTQLRHNRIQLGICAKCDPDASKIMKTEEIMREMIIKLVDFEPSSIDSSIIGVSCEELERRRPDFIYVLPHVVIVIEIDEDSHVHYDSSCEISKVSQQNAAIQLCDGLENVDVITIRLNPDAYHIGKVSRETRAKAVANRVNELIDEYGEKQAYERTGFQRVEYFYYHEKSQHHIDAQGQISDIKVFPKII